MHALKKAKRINDPGLIDMVRDFLINHHAELMKEKKEMIMADEDLKEEMLTCLSLVAPYRLIRKRG